MFFIVINPSLKITGSSFLQSTTDDSMPTSHPSKSKISEISQVGPFNFLKSCFTCSAEVGLTPPDLFALGAKIGVSHFDIKSKATGWEGILTASVFFPLDKIFEMKI